MQSKVSFLILTYNAPSYVIHTLKTLYKTNYDNFEVIVFDNNSNYKTKKILKKLQKKYNFKLILSKENLLWIRGNNKAFTYIAPDSKYTVLLNSDVEIRNEQWLVNMLNVHKRGITACHCCSDKDNRPDGWCFLIDTDLYNKFKLDESTFKIYHSSGALCAKVINSGYNVQTIQYYKNFIYHYGSASGAFDFNSDDAKNFQSIIWKKKCTIIEKIPMDTRYRIKINYYMLIKNKFRKNTIRFNKKISKIFKN